jgi:flagellar biosynthesis/type III secretory pathway M-ring protein FliF/YscJ
MRLLLIFVVLFIFCATIGGSHTSVYVDSKKELGNVTDDLQKKNIKYKIIPYDIGIYEIQYQEPKNKR